LQDIPIDAIVGSVGRYSDFTRSFLPRQEVDPHRWARVKVAATGLAGLSPIEVYQIGDVYFVSDGNHRVSVARELGATHIQAYVTEIETEVSMTSDLRPDDIILKAEYADFLRWSDLRKVLPGIDLILTAPGKYGDLKEHISVHRYYMGIEQGRPISIAEALVDWYETIYLPVVDAINRLGVLRDFPDRTDADLYLWIAEHRAALEEILGWQVEPADAAEDLVTSFSSKPERVLARVSEKIIDTLTPESLGLTAPTPGEWRERQLVRYGEDMSRLFRNILVTLDGRECGWQALDQALELARREDGRILGLHIVPTDDDLEAAKQLGQEFDARCRDSGVPAEFATGTGSIAHEVAKRARWADLVVAPLNFPPGSDPIGKLRSGFRTMIVRSPAPVLAVPAPIFPLSNALLAYDGSPKSREALFVATYLAGSWPELSLVVLTTHPESTVVEQNLDEVRSYLAIYGLDAEYVGLDESDTGAAICETAASYDSRLIIMGGYGHSPVMEVVLGSAVNEVLRTTGRATLICS
ncbi:MAG: universal stress protein, partial [Anaerolineae bacterium]